MSLRDHISQPLPALVCRTLALVFCLGTAPLHAGEVLKVGLYQNAPKVFRDAQGKPAGLFVDILDAVAHKEGWHLDYVNCAWATCLRMLERGELDLMPDVAYSPEREQRFDFHHEPVLSNWTLLYAKDARPFHTILDLEGKRIAVIAGSNQLGKLQMRLTEFGVKASLIELSGSEEAMQAVADGRADAALVNRLYGLQHAGKFRLEPTHILLGASQLFYATTQGRHAELLAALDRDLSAMKADDHSAYYQALQRWVEPFESKSLPSWLPWLAAGLSAVLLLLAIHVFSLRRAVRRNTAELERQHHALAESETTFRTLFETSADAMVLSQGEKLVDVNPAMLRLFGYPDMPALQQVSRDGISPPWQPDGESSHAAANRYIRQAFDTGHAFFEWVHRRADGTLFPAEVTLVPMQIRGKSLLQASIRDISWRKQNELRLQQLNRALQTLSRVNHTLVHAHDEADLLDAICRTIVESGGYRLAWVGFAQHDENRSINPVARYGDGNDYLDGLDLSWRDDELERSPVGTAIRTGKPSFTCDLSKDPGFAPWREQAAQQGYTSSLALPLQYDGVTFGALSIYSAEADAFGEEEQALLMELADDLAFGVQNHRLRMEHTQIEAERRGHEERLQNSMLQTIQAITVMLEKRDPYTAGHQRRSADLAVAIARELQLGPARIDGIRFGTMIHDIGIVYVPAEIISRPGKLTEPERNIVRSHVQVGYDIVKDIDFPWPVAQMILQHHERLDGSGYPAGLKGEEILFEARIIAVVDVIEAMLSHRPYRAAIGLDAALQELRDHRGIKYDERVVDTCVHLFTDKGYTLPD